MQNDMALGINDDWGWHRSSSISNRRAVSYHPLGQFASFSDDHAWVSWSLFIGSLFWSRLRIAMCPLLLGFGSSKPSTSLPYGLTPTSLTYHVCLSSSSRWSIGTSRFWRYKARMGGGWSGGALPRWSLPSLLPSLFLVCTLSHG